MDVEEEKSSDENVLSRDEGKKNTAMESTSPFKVKSMGSNCNEQSPDGKFVIKGNRQDKTQVRQQARELLKDAGSKKSGAVDIEAELLRNSIVNKEPQKLIDHIPCLFLPYDEGSSKIVIYFHGNAEDIGLAFDLLYLVGQKLQMHVLAVEYPGYGLYKNQKPDEQMIKDDAVTIFDYLTHVVGLNPSDIILFGRSMGSGPSSYLANVRKPFALMLMSAYTSI